MRHGTVWQFGRNGTRGLPIAVVETLVGPVHPVSVLTRSAPRERPGLFASAGIGLKPVSFSCSKTVVALLLVCCDLGQHFFAVVGGLYVEPDLLNLALRVDKERVTSRQLCDAHIHHGIVLR